MKAEALLFHRPDPSQYCPADGKERRPGSSEYCSTEKGPLFCCTAAVNPHGSAAVVDQGVRADLAQYIADVKVAGRTGQVHNLQDIDAGKPDAGYKQQKKEKQDSK